MSKYGVNPSAGVEVTGARRKSGCDISRVQLLIALLISEQTFSKV